MNDQPSHSSPYDTAIAEVRAKRDILDHTLKVLESLRDGTFMTGVVSMPGVTTMPIGVAAGAPPLPLLASSQELPHDTFHGMSIEPAIKKLLQIRKRPMGAQDIANALREGGLHLRSLTPEKTVASILSRANRPGGEIVRISRGMWGLQEWNPTQRFYRRGGED